MDGWMVWEGGVWLAVAAGRQVLCGESDIMWCDAVDGASLFGGRGEVLLEFWFFGGGFGVEYWSLVCFSGVLCYGVKDWNIVE